MLRRRSQRIANREVQAAPPRGLVVVIGAGLAGLVAATTLREAGCDVCVIEAADAPGGTSELSAGWVWRYRTREDHDLYAPSGNRELQSRIWELLPDEILWAERNGARLLASSTGNRLTDGVRLDIRRCVHELAQRLPSGSLITGTRVVGASRVDDPDEPIELVLEQRRGSIRTRRRAARVICAGGGFAGDLNRVATAAGVGGTIRDGWWVRAAGSSDGSSIDVGTSLGGTSDSADGACYARLMPHGVDPSRIDWARAALPVAGNGTLLDRTGFVVPWHPNDWADTERTWQLGRFSGTGWLLVTPQQLERELAYGTIRQSIGYVEQVGARVLTGAPGSLVQRIESILGCELERSARDVAASSVQAVEVNVGITHSYGGLAVDANGWVAAAPGGSPDVLAAGVDIGGIAIGGYTSGLAQALVFGRVAGRAAAGLDPAASGT